MKCSACKYRKYTDLDADAINIHLRGIEILGIYAMQTDEIDFHTSEFCFSEAKDKPIILHSLKQLCVCRILQKYIS